MQLKKSIFLGISSLGLIAGAAQAQKAGDTVGYIGGSYIQTNSSMSAPNSILLGLDLQLLKVFADNGSHVCPL